MQYSHLTKVCACLPDISHVFKNDTAFVPSNTEKTTMHKTNSDTHTPRNVLVRTCNHDILAPLSLSLRTLPRRLPHHLHAGESRRRLPKNPPGNRGPRPYRRVRRRGGSGRLQLVEVRGAWGRLERVGVRRRVPRLPRARRAVAEGEVRVAECDVMWE